MPTLPRSSLRVERAFRRGQHGTVVAEGDRAADELAAAGLEDRLPELLVQIGASHAAQDRYEPAAAYLDQGLALAAAQAPPPPAPPVPAPAPPTPVAPASTTRSRSGPWVAPPAAGSRGLPGAPGAPGLPGAPGPGLTSAALRAARAANRLDWFELTLLDVDLRLGRYADVLARVPRLVDPTHHADVRFAATRAHAAVLAAQGQVEGAHHLLNTAGGLADRSRSRFRLALVEADRSVLLAHQGRLLEAITAADRVLGSLIRPPVGELQQWSNAAGAAVALTLCRAAASAGDQLTAQRMLLLGTSAAEQVGGPYLGAHLDLARGCYWLLERDLDAAEASLVTAGRAFGLLGCAPAAAITTMEQGRLAHTRGLVRSAGPLYRTALDEHRRLGHPREVAELNRLLVTLDPTGSQS